MPAALQTSTRDSSFASTRWTVVRQAADSQTASQHALSALSELCQIYWRPVYVFLRRQSTVPVELDETAISEAEAYASGCTHWSAEGVFEREWAASLARQTLDRLAQEYELGGKAALFEALKSRLIAGEAAAIPYEELANRLGRTAAHLRVDVTRLRARYRAILREEVSGTVVDPRDVDEELRYLRQAMVA